MFQRRIIGLVSYYIGATPDLYAEKTVIYKNIPMNKYFEEIYNFYENIEKQKEKLLRKFSRGKSLALYMSTYQSYTRQASNFVFPLINSKINGETRPRPGKFRISEKESVIIDEGKDEKKIAKIKENKAALEYIEAIKFFINGLNNYFMEIFRNDKTKGLTIQQDVNTYLNKYQGKFSDFFNKESKKSKLFEELYKCSPKMITIIFSILKSKGPTVVYSNYVDMEGLQIFRIYLSFLVFQI